MRLNKVVVSIGIILFSSNQVSAAALDRSGQSISAFLQPNHYFEFGLSTLDPNISGQEAGIARQQRALSDMAQSYLTVSTALKLQLTEKNSFGIIYDQPFGAKSGYQGNNQFVSESKDPILSPLPLTIGELAGKLGEQAPSGQSGVDINIENISLLWGYQPTKNWNLYTGVAYQSLKGHTQLRGSAFSIYNGYDLDIPENAELGWIAGVSFQRPEIGLKTALTYRSEIEHTFNARENFTLVNLIRNPEGEEMIQQNLNDLLEQKLINQQQHQALQSTIRKIADSDFDSGKSKLTTPKSVNFDTQIALRRQTVTFANIRWVNWKNFAKEPYQFKQLSEIIGNLATPKRAEGFDIVKYSKDQWAVNLGSGHKINSQWSASTSLGWDSGAGDPVSVLGPTKGYWNFGLAMQFNPTAQSFISGGVKYFWIGDVKGQTGAQAGSDIYIADFKDNNALGYGLKMGYRF